MFNQKRFQELCIKFSNLIATDEDADEFNFLQIQKINFLMIDVEKANRKWAESVLKSLKS